MILGDETFGKHNAKHMISVWICEIESVKIIKYAVRKKEGMLINNLMKTVKSI